MSVARHARVDRLEFGSASGGESSAAEMFGDVSLAVNPPRQLRMAKRLLREWQVTRLDSLLELAAALQGACHHTADPEEAVHAFFAKTAVFTGG